MKSTLRRVLLVAALGTLGAGTVGIACAQDVSSAPTGAPQGMHRGRPHFGGAPFVGALLRATRQLNLTTQQQASIKTLLQTAHADHAAGTQRPSMTVVGNPGDPGYAAAVQSAEAAATARIQKESALAGQIYALLTSAQQQQLPTVLASIQAKEQARHAQWAATHASGNG